MPIPYREAVEKCGDLAALDELYASFDWTRGVLTYDWVNFNQRRRAWTITTYEIHTDKLETCGCGEKTLLFVQQTPHGIVQTCASCRMTFGMLDTGGPAFKNLGNRKAPLREMYETLKRTSQKQPLNFPARTSDHLDKIR